MSEHLITKAFRIFELAFIGALTPAEPMVIWARMAEIVNLVPQTAERVHNVRLQGIAPTGCNVHLHESSLSRVVKIAEVYGIGLFVLQIARRLEGQGL